MLMPIHRYAFFVLGLALLLMVLNAVRRKQLATEFSLLWICTAVFLMVQLVPNRLAGLVCEALHVQAVALVFIMFVLFVTGILFYYSLLLSRISANQKELIQRQGLLEAEQERSDRDTE